MSDEIMTVKDLAAYLKMTPATIYKLARKGEIPAAKVASEWRFQKELIDKWLEDQAVVSHPVEESSYRSVS